MGTIRLRMGRLALGLDTIGLGNGKLGQEQITSCTLSNFVTWELLHTCRYRSF